MTGLHEPADQRALADALGVEIDAELLRRALTHRSYAYEHGGLPHNERLEFLGDAVLGIVVTDTLYRAHPDLTEGKLAKLRASVVNMRALADVARRIGPHGLGAYVRLGRGEEVTGGRDKASILADTLEAVLGAIYLEHGWTGRPRHPRPVRRAARRRRHHRRRARLEDQPAGAHRRTRARRARVRDVARPAPTTRRPSPRRRQVAGELFAACTGRSKKEAEQAGGRDRLARDRRPVRRLGELGLTVPRT